MAVYSDRVFERKVGEKHSNIQFFRKKLRLINCLGTKQRLGDNHILVFSKIQERRALFGETWEAAIDNVLAQAETRALLSQAQDQEEIIVEQEYQDAVDTVTLSVEDALNIIAIAKSALAQIESVLTRNQLTSH